MSLNMYLDTGGMSLNMYLDTVGCFTWNTPGEGRLGAPGPVPAYILGGGRVLELEPALTRN